MHHCLDLNNASVIRTLHREIHVHVYMHVHSINGNIYTHSMSNIQENGWNRFLPDALDNNPFITVTQTVRKCAHLVGWSNICWNTCSLPWSLHCISRQKKIYVYVCPWTLHQSHVHDFDLPKPFRWTNDYHSIYWELLKYLCSKVFCLIVTRTNTVV